MDKLRERTLEIHATRFSSQLVGPAAIMSLLSLGIIILFAVGLAAGGTVQRRAVLPHDEIVGFPETVPDNNIGQLYLRFKPHLFVANGCVPFPAVDAEGNTR